MMKPICLALAATAAFAGPVLAQDKREMDAHVHGVSVVKIAVEHGAVEIDILSPGMDIVGFEYEASSAEDKDAVAAAVRKLLMPDEIVTLPAAAGCRLTGVLAHLHDGEHDHDDAHGEEEHDAHDHDDHEEHAKDEHGHDDHDEHAKDEHDHDEHGHEDEEHADEARHSEFHVTYGFACDDEDALTSVGFPFFTQFPNAAEIEVQYVTEAGAGTAELTPAAPELTLP